MVGQRVVGVQLANSLPTTPFPLIHDSPAFIKLQPQISEQTYFCCFLFYFTTLQSVMGFVEVLRISVKERKFTNVFKNRRLTLNRTI